MDLSCSLKREVEKNPPFSLFFFYFKEKSLKRQLFPGGSTHQEKKREKKEKKMDIVKLFKGGMNRFFRKTRQRCQLEMFALGVS